MDISYSRLNVTFDKGILKEKKGNKVPIKTEPSIANTQNDQLLQILWDIKVQLYQNRFKFSRIAKFLEAKMEHTLK